MMHHRNTRCEESESCTTGSCPTAGPSPSAAVPNVDNCGSWQQWTACTASCGPASRMRSRGGECQPFVESEAGSFSLLEVDCVGEGLLRKFGGWC